MIVDSDVQMLPGATSAAMQARWDSHAALEDTPAPPSVTEVRLNGWIVENGVVQSKVSNHVPQDNIVAESPMTSDVKVGQQLPWPRSYRNGLLSACDWTLNVDAIPPGGKDAWIAYRKTLRDLPTTRPDASGMYAAEAWPVAPS